MSQVQQQPTTAEIAAKKKEGMKNLRYLRDKHRELVKGIFRFHEVPGGEMSLVFKEFKEDKIERYSFIDGEIYTIPLGLAKHLNKNCWYPEYEHIGGDTTTILAGGDRKMRICKKVRRCSFQSLEFLDVDELPSGDKGIIIVEHA